MKRYAPLQAARSNAAEPTSQRKLKPLSTQNADPLQSLADQSGQVGLLQRLQAGADSHVQRTGIPAQRAATEDEDMLQGKFKTAQLAVPEEEEPLQGRFDTAQAAGLEEEEPLQGKFKTAQLATPEEEEEPLQGRFATAQAAGLEEEEPLQGKFERVTGSSEAVHRKVDPTTEVNGVPVNDDPALEHEADVMGAKAAQFVPEEEEPLQGKFGGVVQKAEAQPNRTGLPDNLKAGVENLSGMSMDNVRVHYNSSKPAQLNALAYAQGTDIHLGSGQEKHLPHEAWHVVQQAASPIARSVEAIQCFKVPQGITDLGLKVQSVATDIDQTGTKGGEIPGAEHWARETKWAATRKLDEWELVKELHNSLETREAAFDVGFGKNDKEDADVVASDGGEVVVAGENKFVTGSFSQINENIQSALSQLCEGTRAVNYANAKLLARICISKESGAYKHYQNMKNPTKKGMETRWNKLLSSYYAEGLETWEGYNELGLIVLMGEDKIYDKARPE